MDNDTVRCAEPSRRPAQAGARSPGKPAPALKPLAPGMRWLLFTASVLVLLAGFQLFVVAGRTGTFSAWTIANPLAAALLWFPDRFGWHSVSGVSYPIFLGTMLLTGVTGLARGLRRFSLHR